MESPPTKYPPSDVDEEPPSDADESDHPSVPGLIVYPFPFGPVWPRPHPRLRPPSQENGSGEKAPQELPETHILESPLLLSELRRVFSEIYTIEYHDTVNRPEKGFACLANRRMPKYLVIAFVETIEEAHQYFELNKYLREEYQWTQYNSSQDTFNDLLLEEQNLMNTFNMLDEEVVQYALKERICMLKTEREVQMLFEYLMFLLKGDFVKDNNFSLRESGFQDMFPGLSYNDMVDGFEWYTSGAYLFGPKDAETSCLWYIESIRSRRLHWYRKREEQDLYVCLRRHYALVFKAREKGYVMDENPEVELQKDIMYDSWFFHHFLKDGPMENLLYQARTVIVRNVSLDASEQDIRQLFSCGDIEHVKMKSGDKTQTVHVIFKDSQGTESALLVQDPAVLDLAVIIEPRLGSQQRQAVYAYLMSKAASDVNSVVEKAKLDEALEKYKLLRRPNLDSNQASV